MYDIKRIKELDELSKTMADTIAPLVMIDVYERGIDFYEPPRLIICTSLKKKYVNEYLKCFPKNEYIVKISNDFDYVRGFNN